MSGGRISREVKFMQRARAISNAKLNAHNENKQRAAAQAQQRSFEDAAASGRLSEREVEQLEAKLKREAKAAKAALFLAEAEREAASLERSGDVDDTHTHRARATLAGAAAVVLTIRPDDSSSAVWLTIRPTKAAGPRQSRPERPAAALERVSPADRIAALVRHPGGAASSISRGPPAALGTPSLAPGAKAPLFARPGTWFVAPGHPLRDASRAGATP